MADTVSFLENKTLFHRPVKLLLNISYEIEIWLKAIVFTKEKHKENIQEFREDMGGLQKEI